MAFKLYDIQSTMNELSIEDTDKLVHNYRFIQCRIILSYIGFKMGLSDVDRESFSTELPSSLDRIRLIETASLFWDEYDKYYDRFFPEGGKAKPWMYYYVFACAASHFHSYHKVIEVMRIYDCIKKVPFNRIIKDWANRIAYGNAHVSND